MLPFPSQEPPRLLRSEPQAPPAAETDLLDAYDWGRALPPAPALRGQAALDLRWLRAAATFDPAAGPPESPYASGSAQKEARALADLLRAPTEGRAARLGSLSLQRSGTALALWRWGQQQVRQGAFPPTLQHLWEDRLLTAGPPMVRGFALRHALCWALARKDEARLVQVRRLAGPDTGVLKGLQSLFGLLDGPSPVLRFWSLPDLASEDRRLDELGARRIWICPDEDGALPALPPDTVWIVPSATGTLDEREATLSGPPEEEAQALAARLRQAGRSARFAANRQPLERLGLLWFPILIDLDAQGNLTSIRMGDAAR